MNIFILDTDINKCAQYHTDKHIVKMPTEAAQLLCGAVHIAGNVKNIPYDLVFRNHPCAIWTRASVNNYIWLCEFGLALCCEYTYRYRKIIKSQEIIEWCINNIPDLPDIGQTPFALAMPDDCKMNDPVKSYRNYYRKYKTHLFRWKNREKPSWLQGDYERQNSKSS